MAKKKKESESDVDTLVNLPRVDEITLDEIEDLDDSDKSPVIELEDGKEFDDLFIEEISPVLTDEEKEANLNLIEEEIKELSEGSSIPGDVIGEIDDNIFVFEDDVPEEEPAWAKFDDSSIKASIDAGEILPELKPRKNAIYHATLNSLPKEVKSAKGDFYTVEIEIDGMRKSLKANRSFNFALKRYKVKNQLKYSDLVGREIVFQKDENGYMVVQFK